MVNYCFREKEVAFLIIKGFKRKQIAGALFVSEDTIKTHIRHIFKKLNISSSTEFKNTVIKELSGK